MDHPDKPTKTRMIPLEDVIAPVVFIVVMAGAVVAWRIFGGTPVWLAAVLGVPSGFALVLGGVWLLARVK
jgi:hypothetical protein